MIMATRWGCTPGEYVVDDCAQGEPEAHPVGELVFVRLYLGPGWSVRVDIWGRRGFWKVFRVAWWYWWGLLEHGRDDFLDALCSLSEAPSEREILHIEPLVLVLFMCVARASRPGSEIADVLSFTIDVVLLFIVLRSLAMCEMRRLRPACAIYHTKLCPRLCESCACVYP